MSLEFHFDHLFLLYLFQEAAGGHLALKRATDSSKLCYQKADPSFTTLRYFASWHSLGELVS